MNAIVVKKITFRGDYHQRGSTCAVSIHTTNGITVDDAPSLDEAFNLAFAKMLREHGAELNGKLPNAYISTMYTKPREGMLYQGAAKFVPIGDLDPLVVTAEHSSLLGALLLSMVKALARLSVHVQVTCL